MTRTLVVVIALAVATTAAGEEQIQRIASRPGVTQSFVLVRPAGPPVASAVLLPGGRGRLGLERGRLGAGATNFLVRNRAAFAAHGLLVAVLDAPSDRVADGLVRFRTGPEHAEDVRAVIAALRAEAEDIALDRIRVPTLVVHHRDDGCRASRYADTSWLIRQLSAAPKRERLTFTGGDAPQSDPCEPLAPHGYFGIDATVVEAIARWIVAASPVVKP